ncbi:DNA replication/repair protein RecF [Chloroflexota bacterium]
MYVSHLTLANFRNYNSLEIDLGAGAIVLCGDNAQGKTNLLEAIYLLATSKSPRASADRELVNWDNTGDDIRYARLWAQVEDNVGAAQVEIVLTGQPDAQPSDQTYYQKHIKVNGVSRRATDLIGVIRVVMFEPQDTDIVGGSPSLRRRYLDAANSQVDSLYLRNLQQYGKILVQRNHLLRMIREHRSGPDELAFWDEQLIEAGSYIINKRQESVDAINTVSADIHKELTNNTENLDIEYARSVPHQRGQELKKTFSERIQKARGQEIARGVSVVGPHRDDLRFFVGGINMCTYGSRGQHRTIALSLKLAQARYIEDVSDDSPILLLDDVLSELDSERRRHLLRAIQSYQQAIITATDWDHFDSTFLDGATKFAISRGILEKTQ